MERFVASMLIILIALSPMVFAVENTSTKNVKLSQEQLGILNQTQNNLSLLVAKIENLTATYKDNEASSNMLERSKKQAVELNDEIVAFIASLDDKTSTLSQEEINEKIKSFVEEEAALERNVTIIVGDIKDNNKTFIKNVEAKKNQVNEHKEQNIENYQSEKPYEGITKPSEKADIIIVPETTLQTNIGDAKIIRGAPLFTQETKFWCGPASVQSIIAYWGYYTQQEWLADQLNTSNSWDGTGPQSIVRFFESFNKTNDSEIFDKLNDSETLHFYVEKKSADFEWLKSQIDEYHPVVVRVKTGYLPSWNMDVGHYMVVVGYSNDGKEIFCNDPAKGAYVSYPTSSFMKAWESTNKEAILVMPKQVYDNNTTVVRSTLQGVLDEGVYGVFVINWFENYCPHCKKNGTLVVNPKDTKKNSVPEVEITCGHGVLNGATDGCDADYSGWSGYDKVKDPKVKLESIPKAPIPSIYKEHIKPIEMIQFLTEGNSTTGSALLLEDGSVLIIKDEKINIPDEKIQIPKDSRSEAERLSQIKNISKALVDLVRKYKKSSSIA